MVDGNSIEIWRTIDGFANYEVSNRGQVRSLPRIIRHKNRWGESVPFQWKGRILKPMWHRSGYLFVKLGIANKMFWIHRLVAAAWLGKQPDDMVVNHINGVKTDNYPENLEYITNAENVAHAHRTGLMNHCGLIKFGKGENHPHAKLTDSQARHIQAAKGTRTANELSSDFGVTANHIRWLWTKATPR